LILTSSALIVMGDRKAAVLGFRTLIRVAAT
jgi:hypothetical protein